MARLTTAEAIPCDVRLPQFVEVWDYHEFDPIEEMVNAMSVDLKFIEIGYDPGSRKHVGMVYSKKQRPTLEKVLANAGVAGALKGEGDKKSLAGWLTDAYNLSEAK